MFYFLLVTATTVLPASSLQASCEMRLHNDGAHIGKVTFSSYGNEQRVEVILKGDPEKVTTLLTSTVGLSGATLATVTELVPSSKREGECWGTWVTCEQGRGEKLTIIT